jgi:tetratricopeptide (TPR) repeat protein
MIGKHVFGVLASVVLVASAAVNTVAQVGELRGKVFMQQADGQKVPLAGAEILVVRMDLKADYPNKTDKKGEFVFAGLPLVGQYTVAAFHSTASPDFVGGVRVGQGVPVEIVLTPGDGRKLTVDEIKKAAAGGNRPAGGSSAGSTSPAGGGESAVDKAKLEELKKKNAEIEASNKKIEEANAVINRTFKAGNEALNAANVASRAGNRDQAVQKYSDAVTAYDEGLGADPDQPAILTNKAAALKGRGVERYNGAIKSTDDAGKTAALEQAKGDFKAAAEASSKAATLIKAQTAPSDPTDVQRYNSNKYAAFLTNAESMRLFVTKVDGTQAEAGLTAFRDYIAVETDPAKKSKAQLDAAQMLLDAGAADKALAEFQAILATQPDSPEANLGAGLALYANQDKVKFQEAANYLQHFVDVAPDSNPMKSDAKAILTELKNTEKVVPEKIAPKRPRRP